MRRFVLCLAVATVLAAGAVAAQNRPPCFDPFPVFDPGHPGACYQDTDLGVILNLLAEESCVRVETFGSTDDFLRWAPDGSLHTHQSELHAEFHYCPPGAADCSCNFFAPSEGQWIGTGQFYVNAELDPFFNFTCPAAILGHGIVTEPGTERRHRVQLRMIAVPAGRGDCRMVANEIQVTPLEE